ncbi:MAG: 2-oxoacid:acceptor oxidoreductase family protein [Pseudomonadota bacterium]
MKKRRQIVLSGVGGQGLISCGCLIGEAAVLYEGKYATLSSSYGVETRGTFTKSDVMISDSEIFYPEVLEEDIVLSLAAVAYDRYVPKLEAGALLFYDSGMVENRRESKAEQFGFAFTDMARELGSATAANIIALGAITGLTRILKPESIIKAIENTYKEKPKVMELNIRAFQKGLELVK